MQRQTLNSCYFTKYKAVACRGGADGATAPGIHPWGN